jgi:hypothetical protein
MGIRGGRRLLAFGSMTPLQPRLRSLCTTSRTASARRQVPAGRRLLAARVRPGDRGSTGQLGLRQDPVDVLLDRRFADAEPGGDLLVRQAAGDVAGDLELARRQHIEDRCGSRPDRHADDEERQAKLLGGLEVDRQTDLGWRRVVDREDPLPIERLLWLLGASDGVAKTNEVIGIEMKVAAAHRPTVAADTRRTLLWP